ncbi:MAG: hypothetical protein ACJ8G4_14180 [Burkholderiales bacterium]
MRGRLLVLAISAALAGCAELQLPAMLQPPADQVDSAIREAAHLARAPAADQKAALAAAQQAFVGDPGTLNRLRLATFLASLPPPLRDDARAAELLEPMVDPSGSATGRFAAFLATQVAERQRIAREIERLNKERVASERERQAADKERDKREEALRQQLEALRAIERGILDREERLRRNPGAKP